MKDEKTFWNRVFKDARRCRYCIRGRQYIITDFTGPNIKLGESNSCSRLWKDDGVNRPLPRCHGVCEHYEE